MVVRPPLPTGRAADILLTMAAPGAWNRNGRRVDDLDREV
jgi:hypothetical protein